MHEMEANKIEYETIRQQKLDKLSPIARWADKKMQQLLDDRSTTWDERRRKVDQLISGLPAATRLELMTLTWT